MPHSQSFTVIDRETNEVRDVGLTDVDVVDQHVELGSRSSSLALLRYLETDAQISLGPIIVRRTG